MAWNPSPKVYDCREIARKWGHQQVIVIALNVDACKIEMVTYGETKAMCADAKRLGDAAYDAVGKRRIKQNAWGNWYGYEGSRRVNAFAETPEYSMEQNAERWRDGIE